MNLNRFVRSAYGIVRNKYDLYWDEKKIINIISLSKNRKTVSIFGSPGHSNMGDQAQMYCIQKWINQNFEEYQCVFFTLRTSTDKVIRHLRKQINSDDLLMFHSGYHLTDLYREKDVYCKIAQLFPDFKIFIFPQTINFKDKDEEKKIATIFNKHGKITLCCRDELSYQNAQKIFVNCRLLLYPDIVTSLIGSKHYTNNRQGILFCMRNDIEAFYKVETIQKLRDKFENITTEMTDTTISIPYSIINEGSNREKLLIEIFEQFSKYKLVITDRYHGTIFSLIAGTPVIVVSSTDHKLSSGVKWFPVEFENYVKFAPDLEDVPQLVHDILSNENLTYHLMPYFEENYYSVLKSKL